jgi:NitT/TauT family transport system substrate-binding protein
MRVFGVDVRSRLLACLALAVITLPAQILPAQAQTTIVRFALDWRFEGPQAPFAVTADKGYFTAEGLDVTIEPGSGSVEPIARVASGAFDIGIGDINTLIKYHDQNPSNGAKAVFMVYNRPPFSIVSRKSRGIVAPKDLEGKKVGAPVGDSTFAQWPVFVQANGIDASKVMVENIGFPVREPMLAAGQVDAVTGFSFSSYITLKDRGVPVDDIVLMRMSDHGVKLYGNAILVNAKFAAEKPEAVKAFLRAFVKGLKDAIRDPAHAVESVLKRNDLAKRETELERLRMAIHDNIDQIAQSYKFKNKPNAADIFDPSFLPPQHELRVH